MSTREKRVQVLMTPELREKIERIAKRNRWSVSSCAFYLLEHAVKTWTDDREGEELVGGGGPVWKVERTVNRRSAIEDTAEAAAERPKSFTQFYEDRLAARKLEAEAKSADGPFLSDEDLMEEEEEVIKKRKRKVLVG